MKVRQAVVMVGGLGTRLRPLTESCPKPALPVAGRPCLWYLLRSMSRAGIEEIILACGYRSAMMREALGDGSDLGVRIRYSYEDEPRGTGGALKLLEKELDPVFVAANGDVYADIDVSAEVERHFSSGADITVALTEVPNPWEFGVARISDEGFISEFREGMKPEEVYSNLINAGVYVVDKRVMESVPEGVFYDFSKHLFPEIIARSGKIAGYPLSGTWMDVGRPSDYVKANLHVAGAEPRVLGKVSGSEITGPFYLAEGSEACDSKLDSVSVMPNVSIKRASIRRAVVLDGSVIEGATVEDSIVGRGCRIMEGAKVVNSVLADGDVVGPGETRDDGRDV